MIGIFVNIFKKVRLQNGVMGLKELLGYSILTASVTLGGCSAAKMPSLTDYLKGKGIDTSTELYLAEKSKLKKTPWQVEKTQNLGSSFEKLIKTLDPKIVSFGEIPSPIWVSSHSCANRFSKDILPAMKNCGFNDLVVAYVNLDTTNEDLALSQKNPAIVSQANIDLEKFKCADLMKGCRTSGVKIIKGGFMPRPEEGYVLSIENYLSYGKTDHIAVQNPHFVDILGDVRSNSTREIVKLFNSGKKVMFYGPHDFVSLEEKALHASTVPNLPLEQKRYSDIHNYASFAKEFREEGFGEKYMSVYIVPPDFIDHAGLLSRSDFRMCWDKKLPDTAQIFWQKVENCYNVMIVYPHEKARSGTSLKDKVWRNSADEEVLLEPELPKEK